MDSMRDFEVVEVSHEPSTERGYVENKPPAWECCGCALLAPHTAALGRFMVPMHAKKIERGLSMRPTRKCFCSGVVPGIVLRFAGARSPATGNHDRQSQGKRCRCNFLRDSAH